MSDPNIDALASGEEMSVTTLFLTNALEHKDIMNKLLELRDATIRIEAQTSKTNGRVSVLERLRWIMMGVLILLVPIVFFLTNTVLNNTGVIRKLEQVHAKELSTTPNSQVIK